MSGNQLALETLLNEKLKENYLKTNQHSITAKKVAVSILNENQRFQSAKFWNNTKFGDRYLRNFYRRWGLSRGNKRYFPKSVIEDELKSEGLDSKL